MSEQEKKPRRRVKKVKGHGDHHGGAWKVAYADFVTAMMALFLVLWLVSQADTKLKASIANYFRSPGVFETTEGGILQGPSKVSKEPSPLTSKDDEQALFSAAALLRKQFASRPEFSSYREQIKIEITEQGLHIQLLDKAERVSFPSSSAVLTPEARLILAEIAHGICGLPNPISVGGHTDRHLFPAGSTYTNWELSADRANAARRELEANCVPANQIHRVIGYADTELLVPEDPYSPANRRISITVMRLQGEAKGDVGISATKNTPDAKDSASINEPVHLINNSQDAGHKAAEPMPGKQLVNQQTEKQLAKTRLQTEGAVRVGTPDQLPTGVTRTREPARSVK